MPTPSGQRQEFRAAVWRFNKDWLFQLEPKRVLAIFFRVLLKPRLFVARLNVQRAADSRSRMKWGRRQCTHNFSLW
jgi:hypothetical protein